MLNLQISRLTDFAKLLPANMLQFSRKSEKSVKICQNLSKSVLCADLRRRISPLHPLPSPHSALPLPQAWSVPFPQQPTHHPPYTINPLPSRPFPEASSFSLTQRAIHYTPYTINSLPLRVLRGEISPFLYSDNRKNEKQPAQSISHKEHRFCEKIASRFRVNTLLINHLHKSQKFISSHFFATFRNSGVPG